MLYFAYLNLKNFDSPELFLWLGYRDPSQSLCQYLLCWCVWCGEGRDLSDKRAGTDAVTICHPDRCDIPRFQLAGLAGGFVLGLAVQALLNYRFLTFRLVRFKQDHIRSLFGFSFWSFLAFAGRAPIYAYADTLLIAYFMSSSDVGIYRTVYQFTTIACFITLAMQVVLFPKISSWNALGEKDRIEQTLARAITSSLLLAVSHLRRGMDTGRSPLVLSLWDAFCCGNLFTLDPPCRPDCQCFHAPSYDDPQRGQLSPGVIPDHCYRIGCEYPPECPLDTFLRNPRRSDRYLLWMSLNGLLAYRILSKIMVLRSEIHSLTIICIAASAMGLAVLIFRYLFPSPPFTWYLQPYASGLWLTHCWCLRWIQAFIRKYWG